MKKYFAYVTYVECQILRELGLFPCSIIPLLFVQMYIQVVFSQFFSVLFFLISHLTLFSKMFINAVHRELEQEELKILCFETFK